METKEGYQNPHEPLNQVSILPSDIGDALRKYLAPIHGRKSRKDRDEWHKRNVYSFRCKKSNKWITIRKTLWTRTDPYSWDIEVCKRGKGKSGKVVKTSMDFASRTKMKVLFNVTTQRLSYLSSFGTDKIAEVVMQEGV